MLRPPGLLDLGHVLSSIGKLLPMLPIVVCQRQHVFLGVSRWILDWLKDKALDGCLVLQTSRYSISARG